jgi:hypothetical protein
MFQHGMALLQRSPQDDVLTGPDLQDWLKVEEDWVEKNTQARRIPGQFKAGKYWRYLRTEILRNILATGQVLRDPKRAD